MRKTAFLAALLLFPRLGGAVDVSRVQVKTPLKRAGSWTPGPTRTNVPYRGTVLRMEVDPNLHTSIQPSWNVPLEQRRLELQLKEPPVTGTRYEPADDEARTKRTLLQSLSQKYSGDPGRMTSEEARQDFLARAKLLDEKELMGGDATQANTSLASRIFSHFKRVEKVKFTPRDLLRTGYLYHGTSWKDVLAIALVSGGKMKAGTAFAADSYRAEPYAKARARKRGSKSVLLEFDRATLEPLLEGYAAAKDVPLSLLTAASKEALLAEFDAQGLPALQRAEFLRALGLQTWAPPSARSQVKAPTWRERFRLWYLQRFGGPDRTEEIDRLTWDHYARAFQAKVPYFIADNHAIYKMARENGDGHVATLEKELGFYLAPLEKDVVVPTPQELAAAYDRILDGLVAEGQLAREDALRPARTFRGPGGKLAFIEMGHAIPAGYRPIAGLLTDRDWLEMLAAGYITVGEVGLGVAGNFTEIEHDLGHLTGLLAHPRYMAEMRKAAKRLVANEKLFRFGGTALIPKLHDRFFFAAEYLSVIKPEAKEKIESVMLLPKLAEGKDYYTASEVQAYLKTKSASELKNLRAELRIALPKAIDNVGGAARDLIVMATSGLGKRPESLAGFLNLLTYSHDADSLAYSLARLQVAILEFSKVSPEDFLREALQEKIDPKSRVYEIMVRSEIFGKKGESLGDHGIDFVDWDKPVEEETAVLPATLAPVVKTLPPSLGSKAYEFVPEGSLDFKRISISRALQHSFGGGWQGEKLFDVPLTATDHLLLGILGTPLWFIFTNNQHHFVEAADEKRVSRLAKRYRQSPAAVEWEDDLLRQIRRFEAQTGWGIVWTDDPDYLAKADRQGKRLILNVGWAMKSAVRSDRRRGPFLASILARAKDAIAVATFQAETGWRIQFLDEERLLVDPEPADKLLILGTPWIERSHTMKHRYDPDLPAFLKRVAGRVRELQGLPPQEWPDTWWGGKPAPKPKVPEAELIDALVARLLAGAPEGKRELLARKLRVLLAAAKRGNFDERGAARFVADGVAELRSFRYNDDFFLSGDAALAGGELTVTVYWVHREPKPLSAIMRGDWKNSDWSFIGGLPGVSDSYAEAVYALLRAAALKAAADPNVRSVRFTASGVANEGLVEFFTELGFTPVPLGRAGFELSFPVR